MLAWWLTLPSRREDDQTVALRGSKSRNKVSVGEPAEGSLKRLTEHLCFGDFFKTKFSVAPVHCTVSGGIQEAGSLPAPLRPQLWPCALRARLYDNPPRDLNRQTCSTVRQRTVQFPIFPIFFFASSETTKTMLYSGSIGLGVDEERC